MNPPHRPKPIRVPLDPKSAHHIICRTLDKLQSDEQRAAVLRSVTEVQALSISFAPKASA